jgi:4a-hydroxytetrahydrobiopterin dehydratase
METELKSKNCKPCEGGISPLNKSRIDELKEQIDTKWMVVDNHHLTTEFSFFNYKHTMRHVNGFAELAEEQGHHPVMHVYYAKLIVDIWTHAIDGLSENDFILAAKIDEFMKSN